MSASFFKDIRGAKDSNFFGKKSINNVSEIKPAAKSYTSTEGKEGETNCAIDSEESDIELDNGGDVAIITKKKESLKEETPPPVQTRYSPEADNPSPKKSDKHNLFAPRLFATKEYHSETRTNTSKNTKRRHERVQTYSPANTFENTSGVSFSELIGQLEAASHSSEKELEVMKRKMKGYEKIIMQKDSEIKNLYNRNKELNLKTVGLSESLTSINRELTSLKEEKDRIQTIFNENEKELSCYKIKFTDLTSAAEVLKQNLKAIKSQIQTQSKVQETELLQKASQIDQLSGMLSEEKLKISDLLKRLTNKSEWEENLTSTQTTLISSTETIINQLDSAAKASANEYSELYGKMENLVCNKNQHTIENLKSNFADMLHSEISSFRSLLENENHRGSLMLMSEIQEVSGSMKREMENQAKSIELQISTLNQESLSAVMNGLTELRASYNLEIDQVRLRSKELEELLKDKATEITRIQESHKKESLQHLEEISQLKLTLQKNAIVIEKLEEELKVKSKSIEILAASLESMKVVLSEKKNNHIMNTRKLQSLLQEKETECIILKDRIKVLEDSVSVLKTSCDEMKESVSAKERKIDKLECEKHKESDRVNELETQKMILSNDLKVKDQEMQIILKKLKDLEKDHQKAMELIERSLQMEYDKLKQLEEENTELIVSMKLKQKEYECDKEVLERLYNEKVLALQSSLTSETVPSISAINSLMNKIEEFKTEFVDRMSKISVIQNSGSKEMGMPSENASIRETPESQKIGGESSKRVNKTTRHRNTKRTSILTRLGQKEEDVFSLDKITSSPPNKKARKK